MPSWRTLLALFAVPLLFAWSCANSTPALTCTGSQVQCGEVCTTPQTDPDNCGQCGNACPLGELCAAGKCATECPAGNDVCTPDGGTRGFCVDTRSDNQNCGKCGTKCSGGQACVNGTCSSSCSSPETTCMPDGGGAIYCANLKTDNLNCGLCGFACPAGELCSSGVCAGACTTTQTMCDAGLLYCADLQNDNANCGACGATCGTLQFCSGGQCVSACTPTQTLCGADGGTPFCADTLSDNTNCGSCGNKCPTSKPVCSGGVCNSGACNLNALVLGDGDSTSNTAIQTALQGAGFTVTVQASGTTTFAGTPASSGFGVVWVGPGETYATDMPVAGQTDIVNAHNGGTGTGVIFTEWTGFEVNGGRYQTLKQINLIPYVGYAFGTEQYSLVISGHPIWNGLSSSFTTSASIACTVITTSALTNGGTELASSTQCGVGVAISNPTSTGRVVDFAMALDYSGGTWYTDSNMTKLVANAALWAARCD